MAILCYLGLIITLLSMVSCSTFTGKGKDNTPTPNALVAYVTQVSLHEEWSIKATRAFGETYLTLPPTINNGVIYLSNPHNSIVAVNNKTGKKLWKKMLAAAPSAALAVSNDIVIVGGKNGILYALKASDGQLIWQSTLSDPITTPPAVQQGIVVAKTLDGQIYALNLIDGKILWRYVHGAPVMILAGGSQPIISDNSVIVGFADGKLAAYSLTAGRLQWETQVAQPKGTSAVEQMVDIVANPLLSNVLYVVNYQGNLAALSPHDGRLLWKLPLSSYTGMALNATTLFVTNAKGDVLAVDRATGKVLWHQTYLAYRLLTAPLLVNNVLAIADGEGYIQLLNPITGQTIGRQKVSNRAIWTPVVTTDNNSLLVLDNEGKLTKYSLNNR